jgi:hypothetical protein
LEAASLFRTTVLFLMSATWALAAAAKLDAMAPATIALRLIARHPKRAATPTAPPETRSIRTPASR